MREIQNQWKIKSFPVSDNTLCFDWDERKLEMQM